MPRADSSARQKALIETPIAAIGDPLGDREVRGAELAPGGKPGARLDGYQMLWVDLSSHNANPLGVFDGEAVPLSDVVDTRIEESAESWTEAAMRPSEKTIRRRFGSFREAIKRAALT